MEEYANQQDRFAESLVEIHAGVDAARQAHDQEVARRERDLELYTGVRRLDTAVESMQEALCVECAVRKKDLEMNTCEMQQLKARLSDVREAFDAEVRAREAGDEEQAMLWKRADHARAQDINTCLRKVEAGLGEMQQALDAEARVRADGDIAEGEARKKALEDEARSRAHGDERTSKDAAHNLGAKARQTEASLSELWEALDTEKRERAAGDNTQLEAQKRVLDDEARARASGDETVVQEVRCLQGMLAEIRQAHDEAANERKVGVELHCDASAKLHAALENERVQRDMVVQRFDKDIHALSSICEQRFGQTSAASAELHVCLAGLEGKLRELACILRDELGALEARLQGEDGELRKLFETLDVASSEVQCGLGRERSDREADTRSLRLLIEGFVDRGRVDASSVERLLEELMETRASWIAEAQRLWEAVDTHTHDVNFDDVSASETKARHKPSAEGAAAQLGSYLAATAPPQVVVSASSEIELGLTSVSISAVKQAVIAQQVVTHGRGGSPPALRRAPSAESVPRSSVAGIVQTPLT